MRIEIITSPNDELKETGFGSHLACKNVVESIERLGHIAMLSVCTYLSDLDNVVKRKPDLVILAAKYMPVTIIFYYKALLAGYKMVGNAVPPNLAYFLAKQIYSDLTFGNKIQSQKYEVREPAVASSYPTGNTYSDFDLAEVVA